MPTEKSRGNLERRPVSDYICLVLPRSFVRLLVISATYLGLCDGPKDVGGPRLASRSTEPGMQTGTLAVQAAHAAGDASARQSSAKKKKGQAKDSKFPPFSDAGGYRIDSPKGGVTWHHGVPGTPVNRRNYPWASTHRAHTQPASERLVGHRKAKTDAPQGYYEYTPGGYPGDVRWPLLVVLHGLGRNGNGNEHLDNLLEGGIPRVIAEDRWPHDRPYVVLAPQHDSWGCPKPEAVEEFIGWALDNYPIDPRYVYLVGASCGANSIWSYLRDYVDEQIAAAVVIAGDGRDAWQERRCQLAKVAIWAFHGHRDDIVDPAGAHVPLDGLARCKKPLRSYKKTIYPTRQHDAWYRTYGDMSGHDIYEWMLGFKKDAN